MQWAHIATLECDTQTGIWPKINAFSKGNARIMGQQ